MGVSLLWLFSWKAKKPFIHLYGDSIYFIVFLQGNKTLCQDHFVLKEKKGVSLVSLSFQATKKQTALLIASISTRSNKKAKK